METSFHVYIPEGHVSHGARPEAYQFIYEIPTRGELIPRVLKEEQVAFVHENHRTPHKVVFVSQVHWNTNRHHGEVTPSNDLSSLDGDDDVCSDTRIQELVNDTSSGIEAPRVMASESVGAAARAPASAFTGRPGSTLTSRRENEVTRSKSNKSNQTTSPTIQPTHQNRSQTQPRPFPAPMAPPLIPKPLPAPVAPPLVPGLFEDYTPHNHQLAHFSKITALPQPPGVLQYIDPKFASGDLMQFMVMKFGTESADIKIPNGDWERAIDKADLLMESLNKAKVDNDFVEKYKLAVTGKDRSDAFFNKLADQDDCFTIYLLCILKATKPDTRLMPPNHDSQLAYSEKEHPHTTHQYVYDPNAEASPSASFDSDVDISSHVSDNYIDPAILAPMISISKNGFGN
ncbi:hypothetical protein BS50DRAFT_636077 [Corynespora cassiicola Philippines]|uniref:Uncharacterized protein n=1 Tax=Corynespora cassiicola Philippines TaxID=1448308 RepID=A0A2T2NIM6_CORCC|nr:hypothetical protein BS50DRAFT_636077 [Corynespora cassiicola Philippines]